MEASEAKIEDRFVPVTNTKEIADPIVYQLVRVDGDGRLVPATQDEIMAVEDLLVDDKCEPKLVPDTGQASESCRTEGYLLERNPLHVPEGKLESENPEVGAEKSNVLVGPVPDLGQIEAPEKVAVPGLAPCSELSNIDPSVRTEVCSNSQDAPSEDTPSTSAGGSSWKPDFSKLEGKICLDNLTVKELHETFKATFGRETSVKDKQWLKRRITMGLTNSCDFSCTTFIIRDNVVVTKGEEQICHHVKSRISAHSEDGVENSDSRESLGDHDNRINNDADFSGADVSSSAFESCNVTKDLDTEQRTAKRARKPTKRYIEELSEIESRESSEKLASPDKISRYRFPCPETHMRPTKNVRSNVRPLVTRQDSLGGSGVQIPFVSRIRRSRPRVNFMPLLELQPSGMDMATRQVRSGFDVSGPREDDKSNNELIKTSSSPGWTQQPLIAACEKDEHYSGMKIDELENDVELNDCSEDNSDDNVATIPTQKGGMRRKHHRPWTINEVVKLVEGVARYGAGRWSEIKRLAFASCPYRTSVDLKDKWRNLLKASFVQLPAEKGILNSRKQASVPIPAPILSRVRELADMQGQIPPILATGKSSGHSSSGRSVHEARSGFL
ncbi:uncharacterized protein LOC132633503 [Lycium barbarum]|uniref:uncharacterized protein LOC132633503 n=1 Tax=Lycium barbarum TaxID=112863 RepID=UPI00293E62E3|nr:uncharacterized protein LOC132633503 [Lycium barbarum]XP_060205955.1 uncharacterized protein LOC132633503 [Lycium barbarum]